MYTIPKKIHAVWLGSVPKEIGIRNIENWSRKNPDYEINMWMDTDIFSYQEVDDSLRNFIEWAAFHNIVVRDVGTFVDDERITKSSIHDSMPLQQFYDDEVNGVHKNYAAASDMLRVEILYQEGGVYIDINDVSPGEDSLSLLQCEYGFLCHNVPISPSSPRDAFNNDIIASTVKNPIVKKVRESMLLYYQALYQSDKLVHAHRTNSYCDPRIFSWANGSLESDRFEREINLSHSQNYVKDIFTNLGLLTTLGSRHLTTIKTSGPELVKNVFKLIENSNLPLLYEGEDDTKYLVNHIEKLSFSNNKVGIINCQFSWVNVTVADISSILRHYLIIHVVNKIDEALYKNNACGHEYKSLLEKLRNNLRAYPLSIDFRDFYKLHGLLPNSESVLIDESSFLIFYNFKSACANLEQVNDKINDYYKRLSSTKLRMVVLMSLLKETYSIIDNYSDFVEKILEEKEPLNDDSVACFLTMDNIDHSNIVMPDYFWRNLEQMDNDKHKQCCNLDSNYTCG